MSRVQGQTDYSKKPKQRKEQAAVTSAIPIPKQTLLSPLPLSKPDIIRNYLNGELNIRTGINKANENFISLPPPKDADGKYVKYTLPLSFTNKSVKELFAGTMSVSAPIQDTSVLTDLGRILDSYYTFILTYSEIQTLLRVEETLNQADFLGKNFIYRPDNGRQYFSFKVNQWTYLDQLESWNKRWTATDYLQSGANEFHINCEFYIGELFVTSGGKSYLTLMMNKITPQIRNQAGQIQTVNA